MEQLDTCSLYLLSLLALFHLVAKLHKCSYGFRAHETQSGLWKHRPCLLLLLLLLRRRRSAVCYVADTPAVCWAVCTKLSLLSDMTRATLTRGFGGMYLPLWNGTVPPFCTEISMAKPKLATKMWVFNFLLDPCAWSWQERVRYVPDYSWRWNLLPAQAKTNIKSEYFSNLFLNIFQSMIHFQNFGKYRNFLPKIPTRF